MLTEQPDRLRIFTWHIHGSYLFYLSQGDYDIFIPVNAEKTEGYYGRGETFPFGENVIEVAAAEVKNLTFDCILFQSNANYLEDQYEVLSESQRFLPRIYVEHNTPVGHPTDTLHVVRDPAVVVVHVTHFNKLMWQNTTPIIKVIEHGVLKPVTRYTGKLNKGIVVINHIKERGRITGWDIYEKVREHVPIDLVGMGTKAYGGLGEILHPQLPEFISNYRFFFNPIRYTSFGLAVCEAMMAGMPVAALATTEYVSVIKNGINGIINTDIEQLIVGMNRLINDPDFAFKMGENAHDTAMEKFNIGRFTADWEAIFYLTIDYNNSIYEKANRIYQ